MTGRPKLLAKGETNDNAPGSARPHGPGHRRLEGIGSAAAAALAAAGANVVVTSRKPDAARAAAEAIGLNVLGIAAHAAEEDQARACIDTTLEHFGSLDILVNNAGTNPAYGPLIAQDHGRFAKTMDVNLWGPILWTGLAVRAWMGAHGGSVINTASIGGLGHEPGIGMYNASKAALIYVTGQLALELSPSVRVNAVAPGSCGRAWPRRCGRNTRRRSPRPPHSGGSVNPPMSPRPSCSSPPTPLPG